MAAIDVTCPAVHRGQWCCGQCQEKQDQKTKQPAGLGRAATSGRSREASFCDEMILPEIAAPDKGETAVSLDGGAMPACAAPLAAGL